MTDWQYEASAMQRGPIDDTGCATVRPSQQTQRVFENHVAYTMRAGWFVFRLATFGGLATLASLLPSHALTMAECSAKYNAAKSDGTLNGRTWNVFKNAECGPGSKPAEVAKTPINDLKQELLQAGYDERKILIVFGLLSVAPIAKQCVDDGYENQKLEEAIRTVAKNNGVMMSDSQIARYYQIDQLPATEILTYKGLSDDNRYEFCMEKRRHFAALGLL
ncbi:MAG: hypothetical protein EOR97_28025 [Mesorhizobium sp.]|uniref:hypothetical protein n=1 Tax=Mesorhizobium sp. TaxID=1871066 RepID=UPI000FE81A9A|nr:hypothetical protein [Mesorhizobium sp.]RWN26903.1 MAG: hypothetical protein EOR97_28025 [Mesorhizobium sp.]